MIDSFLSFYKDNEQKANTWFESLSTSLDLPVYTSVDIRDSGYKASSIDTNLFPAGFNNLCHVSIRNAVEKFKTAILSKASECKHILIICEEHTRNKWYLENIHTLDKIANDAGLSNNDRYVYVCKRP